MRALIGLVLLLFTLPAKAEVFRFAAKEAPSSAELVIYSTLDQRLAVTLIDAFQAQNPGVAVRYEDLLADEIARRVVRETGEGVGTADFVFSSAMDLQVKLANDGFAQPVRTTAAADWPRWANWRDTAFALTFEPAVLVYYKPAFPAGPPRSRLELMDWLSHAPKGRIGTYDIERSAVGYLYFVRDLEYFADIWSVCRAMGKAGALTFPTSQDIIDRVADGRLLLGYNILGSYAADQAGLEPDLGLVLLRDFTVVVSRVALVPRAARRADLGAAFLQFLMSRSGQTLLSDRLHLAAVRLDLPGANSARAMEALLGDQLRPVPVSPGLLVYLDQAKRARLIRHWRQEMSAD